MAGRRSRDKGNRLERLVVNTLRAAGQIASRVPLSGAAGGDYQDDIVWKLPTQNLNIECKARAHGFGFLYDNLKPGRPLIVKADHQEPLIVMTLNQAIALIGCERPAATASTLVSPLRTEHSYNGALHNNIVTTYGVVSSLLDKTVREINQQLSER